MQRQPTTTWLPRRPTRGVALSATDRKQTTRYLTVDQQGVANVLLLVPGSPKLLAWEVVSFLWLMYVAVAVPFQMAFVRRNRWDPTQFATYWETGVDVFFIADIVRNCFTAYYDRGTLVLDQRKIIRHYMRSWFLIDLVASFPLDWFFGFAWSEEEEVGQSQLLLLLRLSKFWKLVRLVRLWRVGLRSLSDSDAFLAEAIIAITSSASFWYVMHAAILCLVVHFSGCLQVFFANGSVFFAHVDDDEDGSWLVRSGLSGKSVEEQYAGALVHALLQMLLVAPGLVAPVGQSEYWFYFVSLLGGAGFFMHLFASLTARHVTALFGSQGEYNRRMDNLQRYMDHHRFTPELRQHVRIHQELNYPGGHCFDEETILHNLSRPLQEKTRVHTCRALMARLQIPLETEQGFELAASLALRLKRRVFLPGDYLIKQGTMPDGMFFITSRHPGEVEILMREELDTYKRIPFKGGDKIVGELSLLRQTKATAFVLAKTVCDTELLSKEDYNQLVDSFPLFKEYLQQMATSRGFSDYTKAMYSYDRLEPPKTITMVRLAALQDCKELNQTGSTSCSILDDFYESYRTPEGVVMETKQRNSVATASSAAPQRLNISVIGKLCSDGTLCHQDTGKVLFFNQDNTVAVHTVQPDGRVVDANDKPVGQMHPDDDVPGQDVFDGLKFDAELNSWMPAGKFNAELNSWMPAGQTQKSISNLLPDDAFEEVAFEDLSSKTYGVLTYPWTGMPWRDILLKLKGTEVELFWIGACLARAFAVLRVSDHAVWVPPTHRHLLRQPSASTRGEDENDQADGHALQQGLRAPHPGLPHASPRLVRAPQPASPRAIHRVPFAHTLRHRSCQSPCAGACAS